jgi:hypothetical protein
VFSPLGSDRSVIASTKGITVMTGWRGYEIVAVATVLSTDNV